MSTPIKIDAPNLLGGWLIGSLLASVTLGMVITASSTFYQRYPKETWLLKSMVAFLSLVSITGWAADIVVCWHYLISGRGHDEIVLVTSKAQIWQLYGPAFSALVSQLFFGLRCWRFVSRNIWVGLLIMTSIAFAFVAASVNLAFFQLLKNGDDFTTPKRTKALVEKLQVTIQLWIWSTAFADVLISGILCIKVLKEKKGFNRKTDTVLEQVLRLSLTTAGLTSLVAVVYAIFTIVYAKRGQNWYIVWLLPLPNLYAISTIYTLNIRENWKQIKRANGSSQHATFSHTNTANRVSFKPTREDQITSTGLSSPVLSEGIRVHVAAFSQGDDLELKEGDGGSYVVNIKKAQSTL